MLTRRRCLALPSAWLGASLAGCSLQPDADHTGPDVPTSLPLDRPVGTAWVFSSGGPRGFVHVGVIQALDELGLRPDLIVGASAGALVAVMRASGLRGAALREAAMAVQPLSLARLAIGAPERLSALAIADWVRDQIGQRPLQRLELPVACVAYRPGRNEVVAFTRGDAGLAVAASCAIQGQFSPVRLRGEQHVDADLHQPLPVRVARQLGARRVLAVDASAHVDRAPAGAERYRQGDLRKAELTAVDAVLADVLLKPDFGYWVSLSAEFRGRAIEAGYRATLAMADRLRALHAPLA